MKGEARGGFFPDSIQFKEGLSLNISDHVTLMCKAL